MNKYELMLINSHNKSLSTNERDVTLDKEQFLSSMISLGFVSDKPNKTEKNLLDESFNLLLTLSKSPSLSLISSNNLLLFLLCVIGVNPTEQKINSKLVVLIKSLDFSILTSNKKLLPKNINIKFHLFSDNYYNTIKAEKNIIRLNKFENNNKNEHSFSPTINKNSIKIYNEKWKHRFLSDGKKKITFIDVSKAYQAKKDNFIKKEKSEKLAKEMSNCTFKQDLSLKKRKNSENRKNNMNIDDLIESMRNLGYFSLDELDYAIFESNGKLSAFESKNKSGDTNSLPLLIVDSGKTVNRNLKILGCSEKDVISFITKNGAKLKDVEVITIDGNGRTYFKIKNQKYKILNYNLKGNVKW